MSNLEKALIKVFNAEHHQGHDESQASKHNGGKPRIDKLNPTWEVDQFHWPSECDQLLEACGDSFGEAAKRLNQHGKVVVVTSCHRKEGRTTFALALAKWLSRQQMHVTLVDGDSKNLQLSRRLEVDDLDTQELSDVNDLAILSVSDGVTLLTRLPLARDDQAQSNKDEPPAVLQALTSSSDIVIVDAGPVSGSTDLQLMDVVACVPDAVVLLRNKESTSDRQLAESAGQLRTRGIENVFLVETFCQTSAQSEASTGNEGNQAPVETKRAA